MDDPADASQLDGRWALDPQVALRPERFGALAYHYGSRRLTFLRSTLLADVVRGLGQHPSVGAALEAMVPAGQRPAYRRALAALAGSGFLQPADGEGHGSGGSRPE